MTRYDQVRGLSYKSLRLRDDGSCIFFDQTTRRCNVYEHRPTDCRLFPLDIVSRGGEYYWICYDCGSHEMTEEMVRLAERTILPELLCYLDAYAHAPSVLYSNRQYRLLRKVVFPAISSSTPSQESCEKS
jgi:Fe-S-cluster containining protein